MGRNIDDVIKSLPAERQAKIAALAQKKAEEMIMQANRQMQRIFMNNKSKK